MKKLKDSIRLMKRTDSLSENCLDVCYLQKTVSQISDKVVVYYMTLLAHAAVHERLEMMKFLIKEGASKTHFVILHDKDFNKVWSGTNPLII